MSSVYRVLCLNHDPALIAADRDWNRPEAAEEAIRAGIEGHERCDLLLGRYSYPLVEVGCPESAGGRSKVGCIHGGTKWVDAAWLRLLHFAQLEPEDSMLRKMSEQSVLRCCWTPQRLRRLAVELGITGVTE